MMARTGRTSLRRAAAVVEGRDHRAVALRSEHRLCRDRPPPASMTSGRYILRTRDAGRTWTQITNGLPNAGGPNSVNVVREDPVQPRPAVRRDRARACSCRSTTATTGSRSNHGLPATSVRDITIHGDDLVIATHGRGFYVLDDIVPLRALAANAASGHSSLSAGHRGPAQRTGLYRHADAQGRTAGAQSALGGNDRLFASRRTCRARATLRSTMRRASW